MLFLTCGAGGWLAPSLPERSRTRYNRGDRSHRFHPLADLSRPTASRQPPARRPALRDTATHLPLHLKRQYVDTTAQHAVPSTGHRIDGSPHAPTTPTPVDAHNVANNSAQRHYRAGYSGDVSTTLATQRRASALFPASPCPSRTAASLKQLLSRRAGWRDGLCSCVEPFFSLPVCLLPSVTPTVGILRFYSPHGLTWAATTRDGRLPPLD